MARIWIIRRHRTWLKLAIAFLGTLLPTWFWGVLTLHTDAQAGIALAILLAMVPAAVCFLLAFFDHRANYLAFYATVGSVASVVTAILHTKTNPSIQMWLSCFGPVWVAALGGTLVGALISRLLYRIVISDGTLCPGCAYCLIGLDSQVCPECGRVFTYEELGTTREELQELAQKSDAD